MNIMYNHTGILNREVRPKALMKMIAKCKHPHLCSHPPGTELLSHLKSELEQPLAELKVGHRP